MHTPGAAGWLLVVLCALSGGYCLLRMRSGVEAQRRAAGGEALMGFGMAAMALPAALVPAQRAVWLAGAALFTVAGARALWESRAGAHHLHHLVGAVAMVHMSVAMASADGHGTAGTSPLTAVLFGYFTGYVLWAGARLIPAGAAVPVPAAGHPAGRPTVPAGAAGPPGGARIGWGDRPELTRACRLSMGVAMVAMLLTV
ncbi:DUF5134 domain-containing protein [Streptomyces uncialis]|uniref:DUF5134 domain-containing protein n=1 Tax=Streptomyces uncialis TaxID=1048205 RepID=UPI0037B9CBDD